MRIAITGAAGRLGVELRKLDWTPHAILPWTRADADLARWPETETLVAAARPAVVIHAAASTDLVRCEQDKQYAWENVALPAIHVARACAAHGARLVHVSTDGVFSGEEPVRPIPSGTRPDPVNYYGVCKLAAESAARAVPDHLVVRCTMKARGPWKHPQAPTDMWITHSYVDEVASFLRKVAPSVRQGLLHFGARQVNVYEFARLDRPDVKPITRAEITTLRQPRDVRLEVDE